MIKWVVFLLACSLGSSAYLGAVCVDKAHEAHAVIIRNESGYAIENVTLRPEGTQGHAIELRLYTVAEGLSVRFPLPARGFYDNAYEIKCDVQGATVNAMLGYVDNSGGKVYEIVVTDGIEVHVRNKGLRDYFAAWTYNELQR